MFRNCRYALAAALMTVGAFSSTLAVMTGGATAQTEQIA
jgi:hypothetical protein